MKRTQIDQELGYHISAIWLWLWVIVFAIILWSSIFAPDGDIATLAKLGGVALCLLYVVLTFPRDYLLVAAMFATCIADLILAHNNISPVGVFAFFITQLLHLLRLGGKEYYRLAGAYTLITGLFLLINFAYPLLPPLHLICACYACTIFTNIFVCFRWRRREPESIRALIALAGFVIFACCDSCTVLSYFALTGAIPALFYAPSNFFVWLFYYPSQILVSNTGKYDIMMKRKVKPS